MVGETSHWPARQTRAPWAVTGWWEHHCSFAPRGGQRLSPGHLSFPSPGLGPHPVIPSGKCQPRSVQAPLPSTRRHRASPQTIFPASSPTDSLSCSQTHLTVQARGTLPQECSRSGSVVVTQPRAAAKTQTCALQRKAFTAC